MKQHVVLFQGDSITDANRHREDPTHGGYGYVQFVKEDRPLWTVYNRGISGNRTYDLIERWDEDTLALAPDVLSIYVGINEVWHKHKHGKSFTIAEFEANYIQLIERVKARFPNVKIMMIEPFVFPIGVYEPSWQDDFNAVVLKVQELAKKYADYFIPLHGILAEAAIHYEYEELAGDGVHPSPLGHRLIANEVLKRLGE
jgi:lysophospholipase L1-like esterase